MKNLLKTSYLTVSIVFVFTICSNSAFAQEQENQVNGSLVGRIAHIEGQLLRYVPDEDDWVLTDQDTPFGAYDNLFSSEDGKAEIIMPNNTLVRIGGDTQVQLIELTNEVTEIDVSSGTARLYNKSSSTAIKATTPFGDVIMPPETICDIYVHENQAEIVSLKGSVEFIQSGGETRHKVIAGSSSITVNAEQIIASAERVVPAWNSWNVAREAQWRQRMQARGDSNKYLPESLQDNAFELDTNGRWERVYYEGAYRYFWRPSYVSVGWTPFSSGSWVVWHGEQTWVPCEPFGYVTHHYGNWVYAGDCWYWAPPAYVGMYWYPGRVAWVSSGISIGWFPLAPFEIYYSSSYWGPGCRVRYYNNYYDCHKYRHYRHARYVDHHRFYGSRNYRHAGLRKGHNGENFRGSAFIPGKVRNDFKARNKNQFASSMPKFRDRVKNINVRGDKRTRQAEGNRLYTNPFKRNVAKGFENNRRAGTTIGENTSKKVVGNTKQVQPRLTSANKNLPKALQKNNERTNRFSQATTQTRKEVLTRAKRSFEQPSIKMAKSRKENQVQTRPSVERTSGKISDNRRINPAQVKKPLELSSKNTAGNRRTVQATAVKPRQNTVQKFNTAGGSLNKNIYAKNPVSGSQSLSSRSANTFSANNNSRAGGTSYTRSAGQQGSRQSSTGRMQGYSGRGR